MVKKRLYDEINPRNEVVITVEHNDEVGPREVRKLRRVGDIARLYYGSETSGLLTSDEVALVYPGEDRFIGTKKDYFRELKRDNN